MKKVFTFCLVFGLCGNLAGQTWDEWFRQKKTQKKYLLQQIVKLQIYIDFLKDGYQIAKEGLGTIGSIKDGDLFLHNEFFTNKRKIKASVRKNSKVDEIYRSVQLIRAQTDKLESIYSRPDNHFTNEEQSLFRSSRNQLLVELADDVAALEEIINSSNLEMSDDERISRITMIGQSVGEKMDWVRNVNNSIYSINAQRQKLLIESKVTKRLYGL